MALLKNASLMGSTTGSLLLAVLFFGRTGNLSQLISKDQAHSSAKHTELQRAKTQDKAWPEEGPWKASRQYFAGVQPQELCPSLKADPETKKVASFGGVDLALQKSSGDKAVGRNDAKPVIENERSVRWCVPPSQSVAAMIATVPDPVHSHLSLGFDRTIEALQLSGESMGYEMDRYWLPWQPEKPGNASAQADVEDASEKEKQPGLLMFRWNGPEGNDKNDTSKILYVFLVAETPTTGIDGTQFTNAVSYVRQLCNNATRGNCSNNKDISLIGPTFSGSLASLRRLTGPDSPSTFNAFSGTVSSICAIKNQELLAQDSPTSSPFQGCEQSEPGEPPAKTAPTSKIKFHTLVVDSETAVQELISVLHGKDAIQCYTGIPQVAILSEAATTYGNAISQGNLQDCAYTDIRYPREISSLRNASSSSEPAPAGSQPTGTSDDPTYLPFTLADQQPNSGDEPPDFSRAQGPLSKEAVLMKYAADLRRGHYKFVGILGTNVLDVLFLAKFLRAACPDVRLFIFNSDLLFERDLENAPYIGMLSVSTYPLIGRNLNWTNSQKLPQLPFPDQYEEGQYNAAVLAMREAIPSKGGTLMEVSTPFGAADFNSKPTILPIWLTIVGTGGYWPIQIIRQPVTSDTSDKLPSMQNHDFSSAWYVVTLLLVMVGFLQSWLLITVKPDAMRFRDFSLINAAPPQRFLFINVISVSLAFALALFVIPALKYGCHAGIYVQGLCVVAVLACIALVGTCSSIGYQFYAMTDKDPSSKERRCHLWSMFFTVIIWVAVGTGTFIWYWLLDDGPTHYGFFFSYRSVNLATGVSPLTPILLLLIAVYLWGFFEIWRLRFDDRVRPRLNLGKDFPGAEEGVIACSVNKFLLNRNYCVSFGLIYAAWIVSLHPFHPFNLIEKPAFGGLYEAIFCIVVALMLSNGMRLTQTWTHLHHFLLGLERSSIRPAFSRLKGTSWFSVWSPGGQQAEWTSLAKSFEVMELIKSEETGGDLTGNLKASQDLRAEIHKINSEEKKDFLKLEDRFNKLQDSLANVLKDVMTVLQRELKYPGLLKHPELMEEEADKEDKPVVVHCCKEEKPDPELDNLRRMQEYVALRYVAFIRIVMGHIRLWLILQAAVFSLVLLSLNVYSFEPHRSLVWAFSAIFVLIGVSSVSVLMQMERNHIISRITGTKPNQLDRGFYLRIISLGAVPLLTLLATHFPSIGHYLLSFLQPGLEALK